MVHKSDLAEENVCALGADQSQSGSCRASHPRRSIRSHPRQPPCSSDVRKPFFEHHAALQHAAQIAAARAVLVQRLCYSNVRCQVESGMMLFPVYIA